MSPRRLHDNRLAPNRIERIRRTSTRLSQLPVLVSSRPVADVSHIHSSTHLLGDGGHYSVIVISCLRLYSVEDSRGGHGHRRRITRTDHGTGLLTGRLSVPMLLLDRLGQTDSNDVSRHPALDGLHRDNTVRRSTSVMVLLYHPTLCNGAISGGDACPASNLNVIVVTGRHGNGANRICFRRGRDVAGLISCVPPLR